MGNCQNLPEGLGKKFAHKSKGPSSLIVSTFTWARDSHGLFDYESKTLSKKVFKAQAAGTIRRNINDVIFTRENEKLMKQSDGDLVKLGVREGCFWIDPAGEETVKGDKENNAAVDISSLEQDPWLVVKSYKANTNKGYKLTEGEIIKLGRVKYRIREIRGSPGGSQTKSSPPEKQVINTDADNNASLDESFKRSPRSSKEIQPVTSQTCKICLSESCEADNPFFSPCNCSGTMKLIHVKCLQTWLKSKIRVKHSENTTFTYWKTLECELCKTSYPQYFDVENKRYDIVEIERPNSAYIIMEILSKEKNTTKGIHLVKMEGKNNIRMGRGHDSDIRITDISVSRCHAIIKLEKGNYYIEDNNSKFGTLVHLDKPTPIIGEFNDISLQIGRTVVTLTTKKGKGILPNCFGSPSNLNTSMNERDSDQPNSVFADINLNEIASPTILNGLGSPLSPNRAPIVVIGPRERAYRVNAISNPEENLGVILNARQNRLHNNILQQNMGEHENEGNVGEEAEERSFQ